MVKLIPLRAWLAIAAALAAFALYQIGVMSGASVERSEEKARDATAAIETLERMNNADTSRGDPAGDLDWLRNRGTAEHKGGPR